MSGYRPEHYQNYPRNIRVTFWASEEEYARIRKRMSASKFQNLSAYLRNMAINGYVVNIHEPNLKVCVFAVGKNQGSHQSPDWWQEQRTALFRFELSIPLRFRRCKREDAPLACPLFCMVDLRGILRRCAPS